MADEPLLGPLSSVCGGAGLGTRPDVPCTPPEDVHRRLRGLGRVRAVVVGSALATADADGSALPPELHCVVTAAQRARGAARLLAGQRGGALVCVVLVRDDATSPDRIVCEALSGFVRSAAAELSHYGVSVQGVIVGAGHARQADRADGPPPVSTAARLVRMLTARPDPAPTGQVYLVTGRELSRVAAPTVDRGLLRTDRRPSAAQVTDALGRGFGRAGDTQPPQEQGAAGGMAGRVAIVTGGGGGIGRAVATGLAAEGAAVVVADLGCDPDGRGRNPSLAEDTAHAITRRGGRAVAVCADVSRPDECSDLVARAVGAFGRIDALCHAAGVVRQALVHEATDEDWDAVLGVHVAGTGHLVEACLGPMLSHGHGRIVLFSSRSVAGSPGLSTYSTAKGAVLAFGRSLAAQVAGSGVCVNVVLPSGRTRASLPDAPSARRRRIELLRARHHRIADPVAYRNSPEQDPENNVAVIGWLCGDQAGAVNGQVFGTGGWQVDLYRPGAVARSLPLPRRLTPEDLRVLSA
ncbi:SDR family NAD(P)-dependent oxidoreductase [Streptomyces afghaniensis]|uniref:SDR family NAD(P)-dependent oxidoreductase n=1 Tax=Streptomyces afghaniensis TaxID=66865 RepID=UPI0037882571